MIWFFSRENQKMRLETRYDNDTSEFVVAIERPDGRRETERFSDIVAYRKRLVVLERQCEAEHWTRSGGPLILPEGFPNRRLAPEVTDRVLGGHRVGATVTRTYSIGIRAFEIRLSEASAENRSTWTVERVMDACGGGREVAIPGMYGIVAPTEDLALARASDCIDKWLILHS
jgi:hypothetical protein